MLDHTVLSDIPAFTQPELVFGLVTPEDARLN